MATGKLKKNKKLKKYNELKNAKLEFMFLYFFLFAYIN